MSPILRKLWSGGPPASGGSALWRQWRLPLGVSLALSLLILAIVLSAAYLGGDRAAAGPLAQPPFDLSISRGEGECTVCRQADPLYDAEMGYFNVNCSGCPINDTTYVWSRTPFYTDTHSLGSPPYNSFLFWLHRNKGCGDFQMWGMSGAMTVTNVAPFSIPCTGGLISDTIRSRYIMDVMLEAPPEMLLIADEVSWFCGVPAELGLQAQNRTDTWIQGEWTTWSFRVGESPPWVQASGGPRAISPGGSATFTVTVHPDWSQVPQAMGVAAASPARVTGTLVFSFGPTARISRTLVVAQLQRVYVPLAGRDWTGGW